MSENNDKNILKHERDEKTLKDIRGVLERWSCSDDSVSARIMKLDLIN